MTSLSPAVKTAVQRMSSKLNHPSVIINFKVYSEVDGVNALALAKICEQVAEETGAAIAVCPPMTELGYVARSVNIPVFSQNADPRTPGSGTGWTTPSMIAATGAIGTLINHSEHKVSDEDIGKCIELSSALNLISLVCADTAETSGRLAKFKPDIIAVEPPELIGGDISVTTANPSVVENTVSSVKNVSKDTLVLCGAGVKTGEDVRTAIELGADGVLLASGVVKAKDPKAVLLDLVSYL